MTRVRFPSFALKVIAMRTDKKENLIAAGFQVGTVQEFLQLSDEEMRSIEDRLARERMNKTVKTYSGILLDAESLLNDQEDDTILPND